MKLFKINLIVLLSIITIGFGAIIANAQVSTSSPVNKIKAKLEKPFEKNDLRNKMVVQRQENKAVIAGIRATSTEKIKVLKEERRQEATSTRATTTEMIKGIREERRAEIKDIRATTTAMFKELKNERRVAVKNMQLQVFEMRKNALINELNKALTNMDNIDIRIKARIATSTANGKDMTAANAALVIAEGKLASAKIAVTAFASISYSTSTVTTGTTTNVTLDRPRIAGDAAIKAVKDARDSFKKVVAAVAQAMGVKINATSTISTTTSI